MQMLGTAGAIAGMGQSMQRWGCPGHVLGVLCGVGAMVSPSGHDVVSHSSPPLRHPTRRRPCPVATYKH